MPNTEKLTIKFQPNGTERETDPVRVTLKDKIGTENAKFTIKKD